MRRRLSILLALLIASGLLSACGSADTSAGSGAGTTMNMGTGAESQAGNGHGGASAVAAGARHIEVRARSFAFEPNEIRVKAGENLAIVLVAADGVHDFTIDELGAHVAAEARKTAIGGLRADEPGRYAFYCSVAGHREAGMQGVLVVDG